MSLSDLVRREVRRRFAPADAYDIECLLQATQLPMLDDDVHRRERDRVQLAMLKQADGSFERFARALAQATSDWRDVLVAAGLGNDDWADVLQASGFPVP